MKKAILITVALCIALSAYFLLIDAGLGNGYILVSGRDDDIYIEKNTRLIVEPTIVDLIVESNVVAGSSLRTQKLSCDRGAGYKIRVENKRRFFMLDTSDDSMVYFDNASELNESLNERNLEARLNEENLDEAIAKYNSYYKNIDFSNCLPISSD